MKTDAETLLQRAPTAQFGEELNALRSTDWGEEAEKDADAQAADEFTNHYAIKSGTLAQWCRQLAWAVVAQAEGRVRASRKAVRLEELAELVDDNMDTIRDADPDLAEKLDNLLTEQRYSEG